MTQINVAILGYGRMGGFFLQAIKESCRWHISHIFDVYGPSRNQASIDAPDAVVTDDADIIFSDPSVDVVVLSGLAENRFPFIKKAIASHKHIIAEKPVADCYENELETLRLLEQTDIVSAVDHPLRHAWYPNLIRDFIREGEIGDLAVVRVCHMTPGLAPKEGHEAEGPAFHDCGMHYMDIARYLADSDFKTLRAQGMRFWQYKDPWYLQVQGTFENGVVFDVTQSHAYGQLCKDQTHITYYDIMGSKGICRMTHDFKTVHVELRGATRTEIVDRPHDGKAIPALLKAFEHALDTGDRSRLTSFKDSVRASEVCWRALEEAWTHDMPSCGTPEELDEILHRRATMENGYGLIRRNIRN